MNLGMLKLFKLTFIFFFATTLFANTQSFEFDLIKKGKSDDNTLLIVGGIQGDEPGGFMAASLIATHYKIKKGSVWVVPNLNFYSIIKRSRGPFGDMNRKFAKLPLNDPDFNSVQRIKNYIKHDKVKLVLNLHDGSGFYRKSHINWEYSPYRWGQSSIIDQSNLNIQKYGNLEEISTKVCEAVNKKLIRPRDIYHVKNTNTRLGDKEMEKTLTYFAINNGKAAFGNEASKSLPLHERTYYHLLAIEKYMQVMGIEFERKFKLEPYALKDVIDNDIYISFYDEKIRLPLSQVRNYLKYFPIDKNGNIEFTPSSPVMTVLKKNGVYSIHYGNRRLARLSPDYLDIDKEFKNVTMNIDGQTKDIKVGSIVYVKDTFQVEPTKNIRVNLIGYTGKNKNEAGEKVSKKSFMKNYSVDKNGKIYRVEFYKQDSNKKDKFAGMVLVKFGKANTKGLNSSIASNEYKTTTNM